MPAEASSSVRLIGREGQPPYFTFPLIDATGLVFCGFSTRRGGVSAPPFNSLNVGTTTGDEPTSVFDNRSRLERAFGYPVQEWISLAHGNEVHEVSSFHARYAPSPLLPEGDALISCHRDLPLTIYYADCVPIVLLDPQRPAIGLVHAGWRGTVANVVCRTVETMRERFGTDPSRLLCGLGASIGPCCFEVDNDVAAAVRSQFPSWQDSVVAVKNQAKSTIDLWQLNTFQLEQAGVPRQNIAISRLCTACREDLFFSYRRDRRQTGRLAMLVALL